MAGEKDPTPSDYASLRGFVPERPRQAAPDEAAVDTRISVVDWLTAIGRVVVRRMQVVPGSPVARIHARR